MQTITHTRGTTVGEPLLLTDDGEPLDLTGCTVTARIAVGTTCMTLNATVPDPLLGEAWMDWESLDLPARAYRMTFADLIKAMADQAGPARRFAVANSARLQTLKTSIGG